MFDLDAVDSQFFNRADAHINLSNQQALLFMNAPTTHSMIFAAARFSSWLVSTQCSSASQMQAISAVELDRYTEIFRSMLARNMQDHIKHFDDKG